MKALTLFANTLLKLLLRVFFAVVFINYKEKNRDVQKIIDLYEGEGFKSLFAKIRFWDSPFVQMEKLIPKRGLICDLGCGDGLFTNFLALTGPERDMIGVEVNPVRIREAERGFKNTKFYKGDALNINIKSPDAIVMVHLLHHLNSRKEQENLIKDCSLKLKSKGKLIIAEIDKTLSFKYLLTLLSDVIIFPLLFEKKIIDRVYYRSHKKWKSLLEDFGFNVSVRKVDNKPFTHVILVCDKITPP